MALFLSQIDKNILETLENRKNASAFSFNEDLSLEQYHGKTPWVTMFSNVEILDKDEKYNYNIAKEYFLTHEKYSENEENIGILGGFSDNYHGNTFRPKPHIEDLSISNKGKLGSLRTASVKIICYTYEDLDNISKIYMCPGTSCVIQWGWSNETDNKLNKKNIFESEKIIEENIFNFKNLRNRIFESKGYYDAMVGIITNFSWSLDSDGSINCSVELTSMGESALDLNFSESPKIETLQRYDKNENMPDGCNLKTFIVNDLEKYIEPMKKNAKVGKHYIIPGTNIFFAKENFYYFTGRGGSGVKNRWYINLLQLMYIIDCFYNSSGIRFNNKNIEGNQNFTSGNTSGKKVFFRMLNRKISVTPTIFYEYTGNGTNEDLELRDKYKRYGSKQPIDYIFISVEEVVKSFETSSNIKSALSNILTKINSNSGGIWDLRIQVEDDGVVSIIDKNNIVDDKFYSKDYINNTFVFPLYKQNSIIREFELSANLPDSMKSVALFSINSNSDSEKGMAFNSLFGKLRDRYIQWKKKNRIPGEVSERSDEDEENAMENKKKETDKIKKLLEKAAGKKDKLIIPDKYRESIISYWKGVYNKNGYTFILEYDSEESDFVWIEKNKNTINRSKSKLLSFLPIDLSITIDGISGIYFGNIFTVDYLPEKYKADKNQVIFQVTKVEHNVNKDWTTKLTGQMRIL